MDEEEGEENCKPEFGMTPTCDNYNNTHRRTTRRMCTRIVAAFDRRKKGIFGNFVSECTDRR